MNLTILKKEISELMKLTNPIISSYVEKNSINLVIDKKHINWKKPMI